MKIAIVTGATSGMGAECVRIIAEKFQTIEEIWIVGRNMETLNHVAKQYPEKAFRRVNLDLSHKLDRKMFGKMLEDAKPTVRVLVNAAGVGYAGEFMELALEQQTEMVELNCQALMEVTYQVLPYMTRPANIIQFASAAGFVPQPKFAVYAATKAFVVSFSRALNEELKGQHKTDGIYVTAVCPGPVNTPFLEKAYGGKKLSPIKKAFAVDAKTVANQAFIDACNYKPLSIYGGPMNAFHVATKLLPTSLLMRFM